jgi:hypothetical protein
VRALEGKPAANRGLISQGAMRINLKGKTMRSLTFDDVESVSGGLMGSSNPMLWNAQDTTTGTFGGSRTEGIREGVREALQDIGGNILDGMMERSRNYPEIGSKETLVGQAMDAVARFARDSAAMINNAAPRPY